MLETKLNAEQMQAEIEKLRAIIAQQQAEKELPYEAKTYSFPAAKGGKTITRTDLQFNFTGLKQKLLTVEFVEALLLNMDGIATFIDQHKELTRSKVAETAKE